MIDDATGTELGNRQEPRSGEEFIASLHALPRGDKSRERKPGEVVTWQEALACEVAVGVEVRLDHVAGVGQQGNLGLGLTPQPLGFLPLGLTSDVGDDLVLIIPLGLGRPEKASPALAGSLEVLDGLIQDLLKPAWFVPG